MFAIGFAEALVFLLVAVLVLWLARRLVTAIRRPRRQTRGDDDWATRFIRSQHKS